MKNDNCFGHWSNEDMDCMRCKRECDCKCKYDENNRKQKESNYSQCVGCEDAHMCHKIPPKCFGISENLNYNNTCLKCKCHYHCQEKCVVELKFICIKNVSCMIGDDRNNIKFKKFEKAKTYKLFSIGNSICVNDFYQDVIFKDITKEHTLKIFSQYFLCIDLVPKENSNLTKFIMKLNELHSYKACNFDLDLLKYIVKNRRKIHDQLFKSYNNK